MNEFVECAYCSATFPQDGESYHRGMHWCRRCPVDDEPESRGDRQAIQDGVSVISQPVPRARVETVASESPLAIRHGATRSIENAHAYVVHISDGEWMTLLLVAAVGGFPLADHLETLHYPMPLEWGARLTLFCDGLERGIELLLAEYGGAEGVERQALQPGGVAAVRHALRFLRGEELHFRAGGR